MGLRVLASAGLIVAAWPVLATAQEAQSEAERNWSAIAQCAAIDAAEQRHQCVDGVLQQSGLLNPARVAEAARQEFGRENRAETRRASPSQPPRASSQASAAPAPAQAAEIEELVTTIAAVRTAGYKRLVVTTAEGSVWQQTQAEDFTTPPKPGDRFVIQQAAFDSYRCRFGNASRYRCERVD